jgi:hypothetical protein
MTDLLMVIAAIVATPSLIVAARKLLHRKKLMPKRWLLPLLLLVSASVAQAKLGESRQQILKRFGGKDAMTFGETWGNRMEFQHKNFARIDFDDAGHSVLEMYYLSTPFNNKDANEIIKIVIGKGTAVWREVRPGCWQSTNGKYQLAQMIDPPSGYLGGIVVAYSSAIDVAAAYDQPTTPKPQPDPTPEVAPADPTRTPADCGIIAGQAHDRIKKFAAWSQIVGLNWLFPNGKPSAHAAVFYKYQADGNVFYYDEGGTLELDTTSQDLDAIKTALQAKIGKQRTVLALKFLTH